MALPRGSSFRNAQIEFFFSKTDIKGRVADQFTVEMGRYLIMSMEMHLFAGMKLGKIELYVIPLFHLWQVHKAL